MSLPIEFTLAQIPKHVRNAVVNGAYTKVGVVRSVIAQDGLPSMAVVDFDDEQGVETKLMSGVGTPTHPGMTVRVRRDGGVIDPTWQIVDVLSGPRISFGEPVAALMAKPIIPGASFGGVYTESNTATADNPNAIADPGAPVKARVYLYVRSIVPGSYSAYQQRAKAIRVQGRTLGDTEWPDQTSDYALKPATTLWSVLNGGVTASQTSIPITVPLDRANDMLVDQPAYWQVDAEIFLATATNNGGGSFTLNVVAHNGIDDATLGQGFVTSALGRGLDGTDAVNHSSGATVVLQSAVVNPDNLRPGTDYEIRVAFVNASNQAGPWSDIVGVTTWAQPVPPAGPDNLVVAHLSSVLQADWDPVITDADGHYRSDVKRYLVVRHTAALAVGLSLLQVLSAGATPVDDTPATFSKIAATNGHGNFVGVAAVGSEGLLSEWKWASDHLAPPYPAPASVTIESMPKGVTASIPENVAGVHAQTGVAAGTPHKDPGFKEYLLWQADDPTGSNATIVGRSEGITVERKAPGQSTGYYKVTAADSAQNYNGPSVYPSGHPLAGQANPNTHGWASGWQVVMALYAESTWPQNGNLQDPLPDLSFPKHWSGTILGTAPSKLTLSYDQNAGATGNRAIKTRWQGISAFTDAELHLKSHRQLMPIQKIPTITFWVYSTSSFVSSGIGNPLIQWDASLIGYDALAGGTQITGFNFNIPLNPNIPANTWTKVTGTPVTNPATTLPGMLYGELELTAWLLGSPYVPPADVTILFDSFDVTWN